MFLKRMNLGVIATCLFLTTSLPVMAAPTIEADYFKLLEKIKRPPSDSTPILACDLVEKKHVLNLFNKSGIKDFDDLKMTENGSIYDRWNEEIKIYKGDFSNEGVTEYALISTGGTMHANTVTIYKLIAGQLVNAHLDQIIIDNLIPDGDMGSSFYQNVADPFAIVKNGKTYLRYMSYPGGNTDYDKSKLQLCTYLWQGKQFTLAGPNWSYTKLNDNLVSSKDCIGSQDK